jgi:dTMP kinase
MKRKRGLFIILEGIDGCGKSTQAKMLARYLEKKGKHVFLTHEPSRSKYGREIDRVVHDKSKHLGKKEWLKLFSADRKVHLAKEVLPALRKGRIVVSDRYYHSTLAYQLQLSQWNRHTSKFLSPDLTIIFDLPVEKAFLRLKEKYAAKIDKPTFFEKRKLLRDVRKKFLLMPKKLEEKVIVINGSKSIKQIFENVKKEVEKIL